MCPVDRYRFVDIIMNPNWEYTRSVRVPGCSLPGFDVASVSEGYTGRVREDGYFSIVFDHLFDVRVFNPSVRKRQIMKKKMEKEKH